MFYVYLLRSIKDSNQTYIGYTKNLKDRLAAHNSGTTKFTSKFKPWKLIVFIGFDEEQKAIDFEKYLKVGSGFAFAKKRFW